MVKDLSLGPWCDQQVFQSGRGVMGNVFSLVLGVVPHVPPQQVRRALLGVSVTGSHTFDRGILDVQHSRFNTLHYLTTSQELGIPDRKNFYCTFPRSCPKKCNHWDQQPISAASAVFLQGFEKNGWIYGILLRLCLTHSCPPLFVQMRWIRSLENEVVLPPEQWGSAARLVEKSFSADTSLESHF